MLSYKETPLYHGDLVKFYLSSVTYAILFQTIIGAENKNSLEQEIKQESRSTPLDLNLNTTPFTQKHLESFSQSKNEEITAENTQLPASLAIPSLEQNTIKGLHKKSQFILVGDFIYFKALEDSLNYAERVPQNATFTPKVKSISQKFDYEPGFRVGMGCNFAPWEFTTVWMRYYIDPPTKHVSERDFGLLATLATPVWGALGNSLVSSAKGSWKLDMNVIDVLIHRTFGFKNLSISPLSGIKTAFVKQIVNADYKNFQIEFPNTVSPSKVKGKSSFWGIGPTLGVELNYGSPRAFHVFFNGYFSCLMGEFNTKTFYLEFEPETTPSNSEITIKNSETRISIVEQLQAGIEKKWIGKSSFIEIALGWEVQVWQKQMRLNYFSSFVSPPSGSDLNLYGPFFRLKIGF